LRDESGDGEVLDWSRLLRICLVMLIMVVVVVDGCEGVVGVMWSDGGWCGWRWSGDCVGVLALETVGEAFVGAEDRGGSVDFALVDDGAGASSPKFESGWLLHSVVGDRFGVEDSAIGCEHEWRVCAQGFNGGDETSVTNGAVGVSETPVGAHCEPQKRDELTGPDVPGPMPAVEFELFVVCREKVVL
jgi:hypothetical protein